MDSTMKEKIVCNEFICSITSKTGLW